MSRSTTQRVSFFIGLFIIAASILSTQILQTRILSVMSWYFLAFFTISMAMFGMTAGALMLYFLDRHFPRERFYERLSFLSGTEHLPRGGEGDRRHGVRGDGGARGPSLEQISPR